MTEEMKKAYEAVGELKYFFEKYVPNLNLWRGLKKDKYKEQIKTFNNSGKQVPVNFARDFSIEPVIAGFEIVTKHGKRWREPDVKVFIRNGEKWIKGCRTTRKGDQHWGVSLWDSKPKFAEKGWFNFCLPGKDSENPVPIPASLAITQDDDYTFRSNHYTIAPKDDVPLSLYVQHLKVIAEHFIEWTD
jgi:hypothetical protein